MQCPICNSLPFRFAAAIIGCPSSTLSAIGFSQSTLTPASSALTVKSVCMYVGKVTDRASSRASANIRSKSSYRPIPVRSSGASAPAMLPAVPAASENLALSVSQIATTWTSSRAL